jgi:hypothetical protein
VTRNPEDATIAEVVKPLKQHGQAEFQPIFMSISQAEIQMLP